MRASKGWTLGRYRLRAEANLYNVFNSDFVNSVNTTFSTTVGNQFLRPTLVLQGRLFKLGGRSSSSFSRRLPQNQHFSAARG
jgi:hypothetical protein